MSATVTGVLYVAGIALVGLVAAWLWPALAEFLGLDGQSEERRCPIVKTAYGDLPVGTQRSSSLADEFWTLRPDGWHNNRSPERVSFKADYSFVAGAPLEPLALDALGHPIYEGDRVTLADGRSGTFHAPGDTSDPDVTGIVHLGDVCVNTYAWGGSFAMLRKVHSPEPTA